MRLSYGYLLPLSAVNVVSLEYVMRYTVRLQLYWSESKSEKWHRSRKGCYPISKQNHFRSNVNNLYSTIAMNSKRRRFRSNVIATLR